MSLASLNFARRNQKHAERPYACQAVAAIEMPLSMISFLPASMEVAVKRKPNSHNALVRRAQRDTARILQPAIVLFGSGS